MYTITIPRPDVTAEEVAAALRDGLGPGYDVLPGMRQTASPFAPPEPGSPDTIFVGMRSHTVWRTEVDIGRSNGHTRIRINPGGLLSIRLVNTLGIARRARRALVEGLGAG
jgi:hypothetical protein